MPSSAKKIRRFPSPPSPSPSPPPPPPVPTLDCSTFGFFTMGSSVFLFCQSLWPPPGPRANDRGKWHLRIHLVLIVFVWFLEYEMIGLPGMRHQAWKEWFLRRPNGMTADIPMQCTRCWVWRYCPLMSSQAAGIILVSQYWSQRSHQGLTFSLILLRGLCYWMPIKQDKYFNNRPLMLPQNRILLRNICKTQSSIK